MSGPERVLLDTHVVLWALAGDARLAARHRALFDDGRNLLVSSVVIWEIAIKRSLGKLSAPDHLATVLERTACLPLPISWAHARAVEHLPAHHYDPFDRLLIAQALVEGLPIATVDPLFERYEVEIV